MTSEPNYTPTPAPIPEKRTAEVTVRDGVFLAVCTLLCLFTGNMIYGGMFAGGFAVGGILLLLSAVLYLGGRIRWNLLSVTSLAASLATLVSFLLWENTAFSLFKFDFLLFSVPLFFASACGVKAPSMEDFRALLTPFYLFFGENAPALPLTARSFGKKHSAAGKRIGMILLALIIALPLLAVLTALLISADAAFETFVFNFDFELGELFSTVFLAAILLLCSFPLLFAANKKELRMKASSRKAYLSCLDVTLVSTVLLSVVLLYLVFLVTQLSYLFSGFAGLLPEDYTYADYARRGFFEMFLICLLNLGTVFLSEVFVKRTGERIPTLPRILHFCICLFSLFFIGSAFAKMFLYIRAYGLTFLRLGTSIFMLLLFVAFLAKILHGFLPRFPAMRTLLVSACVVMAFFSLVEPYNLITDVNMYRYETEKANGNPDAIDIWYLAYDCGSYGVAPLIRIAEDETADTELADIARERLDNLRSHTKYKVGGVDLRAESLSHMQACKALEKYYAK